MAAMDRQMASDFDHIFGRTSRSLAQQREQLAQDQAQLQKQIQARRQQLQAQVPEAGPNVRVERLESSSRGGSYSYYQSIEIYNEARGGMVNR